MTDLFTIIIPTHERPMLLSRALSSLAAQSFRDYSVIVVSDSLNEKPPAEILAAFPRGGLYLMRTGECGPAESRNLGLDLAKSDYVIFLDDDDTFDPDHLERLAEELTRFRPDIAYCNFKVVHELRTPDSITPVMTLPYNIGPGADARIPISNVIPNNCLAYATHRIKNIRFDPSLILFEDWDFLLACLPSSVVQYIDCHTVNIHKTERSTGDRRGARNDDRLAEVILEIYKKHPALTPHTRLERYTYMAEAGVELPLSCF